MHFNIYRSNPKRLSDQPYELRTRVQTGHGGNIFGAEVRRSAHSERFERSFARKSLVVVRSSFRTEARLSSLVRKMERSEFAGT